MIDDQIRVGLRDPLDRLTVEPPSVESLAPRAAQLRRRKHAAASLAILLAGAGILLPLKLLSGIRGTEETRASLAGPPTVAPPVSPETQIILTFVDDIGRPLAGAAVGIHLHPFVGSPLAPDECAYDEVPLAYGRTDAAGRFGFSLRENQTVQDEARGSASLSVNSQIRAIDRSHRKQVVWNAILPAQDTYRERIVANVAPPRKLAAAPDDFFIGPGHVECVRGEKGS